MREPYVREATEEPRRGEGKQKAREQERKRGSKEEGKRGRQVGEGHIGGKQLAEHVEHKTWKWLPAKQPKQRLLFNTHSALAPVVTIQQKCCTAWLATQETEEMANVHTNTNPPSPETALGTNFWKDFERVAGVGRPNFP